MNIVSFVIRSITENTAVPTVYNFGYHLFLGNIYKHFAVTSHNKRGHQILVCPLGYTYSLHVTSRRNGSWWRCNATVVTKDNKRKRCPLRVRTKMIEGYEMIETLKQHDHAT